MFPIYGMGTREHLRMREAIYAPTGVLDFPNGSMRRVASSESKHNQCAMEMVEGILPGECLLSNEA